MRLPSFLLFPFPLPPLAPPRPQPLCWSYAGLGGRAPALRSGANHVPPRRRGRSRVSIWCAFPRLARIPGRCVALPSRQAAGSVSSASAADLRPLSARARCLAPPEAVGVHMILSPRPEGATTCDVAAPPRSRQFPVRGQLLAGRSRRKFTLRTHGCAPTTVTRPFVDVGLADPMR